MIVVIESWHECGFVEIPLSIGYWIRDMGFAISSFMGR